MGEKALWPTVVGLAVMTASITIMMVSKTDVLSIALVISLLGNIAGGFVSVMVYGKAQKIEANTNGAMTNQQRLFENLLEYVKNSTPNEK